MIDREEAKLRIVESVARFVQGVGENRIIEICKALEGYVFDSDKVVPTPDDAGKVQRSRRTSAAKDAPLGF